MPQYPKEIWYIADQVTEDIISIGQGEVWTYFYKETLIGVRDARNKVSYFLDPETKKDTKAPMAPTIQNLTEAHMKEAIEEHDQSAEKCHRVHLQELFDHTTRILLAEFKLLWQEQMSGESND